MSTYTLNGKKLSATSEKQKLICLNDLHNLPPEISISTMTITCHFDVEFKIDNIGKYLDLNISNILSIKYGLSPDTNRSLVKKKKNNHKKKQVKPRKNFFNQVTVVVKSKKNKNITVKIFLNGSLQLTGCKDISDAFNVIDILTEKLKTTKAIVDPVTLDKIIEKPFVTDATKIELKQMTKFKIHMINSNFKIGFRIDREKLHALLTNDGHSCKYDPNMHACVSIKYQYSDSKEISIFVFESGAIIITGANNADHITVAYNFINKYLIANYYDIIKKNINENINIMKYLV